MEPIFAHAAALALARCAGRMEWSCSPSAQRVDGQVTSQRGEKRRDERNVHGDVRRCGLGVGGA